MTILPALRRATGLEVSRVHEMDENVAAEERPAVTCASRLTHLPGGVYWRLVTAGAWVTVVVSFYIGATR